MKKGVSLFLLVCLLLGMSVAAAQGYTAGVYEGIGYGMGGELRVSVTLSETAITDVTIVSHAESPLISENALVRIPADIVAHQTLSVDTVSGSTVSSGAVLTAVRAALTAAGVPDTEFTAPVPAGEKAADETIDTDVLVVGGGLSGMSAAYMTSTSGLKTVLIEKLEAWGGASAFSGGAVTYATPEDDPVGHFSEEAFYQWFVNMGHGKINDALVKRIAYSSADTVAWMRNEIGYNPAYEMVETFVDGTVARITNPGSPTEYVTGCGAAMMKIFYDKTSPLENLTMMNRTRATQLLTDESGAVVGAVAQRADGSLLTINAKAVILATGGWITGETYMDRWAPGMKKAYNMGNVGCEGDGIGLCEDIGAKITYDTDAFIGGVSVPAAAAPASSILVNARGERIVAEDLASCFMMAEMMRDDTGVFYYIVDEKQAAGAYEGNSAVVKCDTLEELAAALGMDASVLTATVARYNSMAGKKDEDFGKSEALMVALDEAPYYALGVTNFILTAYAGPDVTENCEVLSTSGETIPGLYAVGELIATNIYGYDDGGHGATLQYCMTTGRIACESICEYLK